MVFDHPKTVTEPNHYMVKRFTMWPVVSIRPPVFFAFKIFCMLRGCQINQQVKRINSSTLVHSYPTFPSLIVFDNSVTRCTGAPRLSKVLFYFDLSYIRVSNAIKGRHMRMHKPGQAKSIKTQFSERIVFCFRFPYFTFDATIDFESVSFKEWLTFGTIQVRDACASHSHAVRYLRKLIVIKKILNRENEQHISTVAGYKKQIPVRSKCLWITPEDSPGSEWSGQNRNCIQKKWQKDYIKYFNTFNQWLTSR